jgi:hypothetical protein
MDSEHLERGELGTGIEDVSRFVGFYHGERAFPVESADELEERRTYGGSHLENSSKARLAPCSFSLEEPVSRFVQLRTCFMDSPRSRARVVARSREQR